MGAASDSPAMRAAPGPGRACAGFPPVAAPASPKAGGARDGISMRPPGGRVGRRPAFGRAREARRKLAGGAAPIVRFAGQTERPPEYFGQDERAV